VARQWVRHRTASWNEVSARYVEVKDDYQEQEVWRGQAKSNRQGSDGEVDHEPLRFVLKEPDGSTSRALLTAEDVAMREYQDRIEDGVAREQARTCLPVSTWTEWRWSVDLRAVLHFLALRASPHAQEEIRAYARAMVPMVESVAPLSVEAWRDYNIGALKLSVLDLEALRKTCAWDSSQTLDDITKLDVLQKLGMSRGEAIEHLEKRRVLSR
jgi:thymidylate synthase (FAD)